MTKLITALKKYVHIKVQKTNFREQYDFIVCLLNRSLTTLKNKLVKIPRETAIIAFKIMLQMKEYLCCLIGWFWYFVFSIRSAINKPMLIKRKNPNTANITILIFLMLSTVFWRIESLFSSICSFWLSRMASKARFQLCIISITMNN